MNAREGARGGLNDHEVLKVSFVLRAIQIEKLKFITQFANEKGKRRMLHQRDELLENSSVGANPKITSPVNLGVISCLEKFFLVDEISKKVQKSCDLINERPRGGFSL